ncbi:MAG: fibronectin type III domain-containing protein [Patescibacteria group bacterium]|jgi:hypothetical protein
MDRETPKGQYRKKIRHLQYDDPGYETLPTLPAQEPTSSNCSVRGVLKQWLIVTGVLTLPVIIIAALQSGGDLFPRQIVEQPEVLLTETTTDQEVSSESKLVSFSPSQGAVLQGELFKVSLVIRSENILDRQEVVVRYPISSLAIEEIQFADFTQNNQKKVDNQRGEVEVISTFSPGFAGQETWAEIIFKAVGEGMATVTLFSSKGEIYSQYIARIVQESLGQPVINCTQTMPRVPEQLTAQPGPGLGEITLSWKLPFESTDVTVFYGTSSGYYQYGIPSIGKTERFIVQHLEPGKQYYFTVTAKNTCAVSGYSQEVSAKAGFGGMTQESIQKNNIVPPVPLAFIPSEKVSSPSAH